MNAFIFSDLHSKVKILDQIEALLPSFDLVIFAGDLVSMGEPVSLVERFKEIIKKTKKPLFWVPGNNDFGQSYEVLNRAYPSLEGRVMEVAGRRLTGVGGSPASWAGRYGGEKAVEKNLIAGTIFVSHYPPPRIFNYATLGEENNGLSPSLLKTRNPKSQISNSKQVQNLNNSNPKSLENLNLENLEIFSDLEIRNSDLPAAKRLVDSPLVHICGHIHHQQGVAYLGKTKIIKVGSAESGHYAIMNLDSLLVKFDQFD
jgi:Icc-related predicted phosphoesterase